MPVDISFLVCAHNEERTIEHFLEQLKVSLTERTEVIIGLDGCTDGTAKIVAAAGVGRVVELSGRRGKSEALFELVTRAAGRIIIVCDVDWDVRAKPGWDTALIGTFNNGSVGGVVIPTANLPEIDPAYLASMGPAFLGEAWGTRFLWEYQCAVQTRLKEGRLIVDSEKMYFPFAVNICLRELIQPFTTTGDDFERCLQVLAAGKELVIDNSGMFLLRATDVKKTFHDMFRQRARGSTVYKKLVERYGNGLRPGPFMIKEFLFAAARSPRAGIKGCVALALWYSVAVFGALKTKLFPGGTTTGDLWALRARR